MEDKVLIIATGNPGKAEEFKDLFAERGYQIKTLADYPDLEEVEETGQSFEENARLKAETIARQVNQVVIADDSGLKVDDLGGMPGIYSARYAGEDKNDARNNAKLLADLGEIQNAKRSAHFHCTLVAAYPGWDSLVVEGELAGQIADMPRGDNGFGYDPLFYLEDYGKTLAQLDPKEKNKISHRAQALKALDRVFDQWLQEEGK
ncbi:Non-canonical purine NTP pyrophosphatase [Alloiococcus otitis]|uniref:dITP/XTP pyrophosphatase n=1 Tax=Alloiococcus otitis ATCC 51267 TaxID=883081 RepID=K9E8T3_9LACT|nr:rdgB/HAM1 family non-canonical purine NTP pyrophosphatase [Alloiococcus otitis ATCC 51267]SUU80767.1 Non-canonical purine NTP pyrophosphatase [Alloiococcus otitis]